MTEWSKSGRYNLIADERGSVALMFGFIGLILLMLVGGAIDYSRAANERTRLQSALDATGLALVHLPSGTTPAQMQQKAQEYFISLYKATPGFPTPSLTASVTTSGINLSASNDVPLSVLAITGTNSWNVGAKSQTVFGKSKIEVALVLDNSGSMGQNGKIDALKGAVSSLIDQLKASATNPDDVKLSLVPFNTQVNIGTSYVGNAALRWDVSVTNPSIKNYIKDYGIPSTPPSSSNWQGCVSDRDDSYQDFDTKSEPASSIINSKYVTSFCHYYTSGNPVPGQQITAMKALTTDLEGVRTAANSMIPTGATNITIGLVMGLATLRSDSPFGTQSSNDSLTKKFVIIFTDGLNTQNRFKGNGYDNNPESPQVDARFSKACATARSTASATVFAVGIGNGANSLLQSCVTDPASNYFPISNASQIAEAFNTILAQISKIRVAR